MTQDRQAIDKQHHGLRTTDYGFLRIHRFALATAGMTFLLLIAGGLVTSTDSGLSVPDWPLSYGTLFPPMVGGIRFEHTHRLIAGVVALMIMAVGVWLWRRESRRWVRWVGYGATAAVLMQAVLGGLTVLLVLPPPLSIAHACLGQVVFCLVLIVALVTAPAWPAQQSVEDPVVRRGCLMATVLLLTQLWLGAVIRHTGLALGWHIGGAVLIAGVVGLLSRRVRRTPEVPAALIRLSRLLVMAVGGQLLLGGLVLASGLQAAVATAHVALGALLLGTSCVMTVIAWKGSVRTAAASRVSLVRRLSI